MQNQKCKKEASTGYADPESRHDQTGSQAREGPQVSAGGPDSLRPQRFVAAQRVCPGPEDPISGFPSLEARALMYEREQRLGRMKIKDDQFRTSCAFRGPRPYVRCFGITQ